MGGLTLLGMTFVLAIGALTWRRHREQRLVDTSHDVRCPVDDSPAHVTVRTDPRAQSCRQHLRVTACSRLSEATAARPERTAYLSDIPPHRMSPEPAREHPVLATEVSCRQDCVFVLNEIAVCAEGPPVECGSGVSDSIDLVRQTVRNPRISRLLYYYV